MSTLHFPGSLVVGLCLQWEGLNDSLAHVPLPLGHQKDHILGHYLTSRKSRGHGSAQHCPRAGTCSAPVLGPREGDLNFPGPFPFNDSNSRPCPAGDLVLVQRSQLFTRGYSHPAHCQSPSSAPGEKPTCQNAHMDPRTLLPSMSYRDQV